GVGPWEEILKNPLLWHFRFGGPDMERVVAGSRAHLPRPVLERVLRHPKAVSRDGPPALREALCPPWRNACGVRAVRGLRPGRCRQQGLRRGGQARCAGSSAGRGKIIRHDDGRSDALCGERCGRRDSSALRDWIMEEKSCCTVIG